MVVVIDIAAAVVLSYYTATEHLLVVKQEIGEFTKWYDLGLCLGLSPDSLDVIKQDEHLTKDRVRAVLLKWLRKDYNEEQYGSPSWNTLAHAIKPFNHALSRTIKDRHS